MASSAWYCSCWASRCNSWATLLELDGKQVRQGPDRLFTALIFLGFSVLAAGVTWRLLRGRLFKRALVKIAMAPCERRVETSSRGRGEHPVASQLRHCRRLAAPDVRVRRDVYSSRLWH